MRCMRDWRELEMRLRKNETINKELQNQINNGKTYWGQVLCRILLVVKTLAKNNFGFPWRK